MLAVICCPPAIWVLHSVKLYLHFFQFVFYYFLYLFSFTMSWESLGQQGDQTSPILKEINPEYSLEELILKLQYFGHLIRKTNSLEKTLMLGKIEGQRRRWGRVWNTGWDGWVASRLKGHEFEQTPGDGEGQGSLKCCSPWGRKEQGTTERLNNNNVVLASAAQWSEPALCVQISTPSWTPLPSPPHPPL